MAKPIPSVDPEASLFVHAAVSIGTRLDELLAYAPFLSDPGEVYELHQMRIAAKRLRYTMDMFLSAYADYSRYGREYSAVMDDIKLLQEHLGNLHDADVLAPKLIRQLDTFLKRSRSSENKDEDMLGVHNVDLDACQGLLTVCKELRDGRQKTFERLNTDWARMREANLFDRLRRLLRNAVTDDTLATILHEPSGASVTVPEQVNQPPVDPAVKQSNSNLTEGESRNGKSVRTTTRRKTNTDGI